jgi:hypothetical protein
MYVEAKLFKKFKIWSENSEKPAKKMQNKLKYAKNLCYFFRKKSENHGKRFAFRFNFAWSEKKILAKKDNLL